MHRLVIYGFPAILLGIEILLRAALNLDTQTFMGPTLAATGIGFLVPLIEHKKRDHQLSKKTLEELAKFKAVVVSSREQNLTYLIWFFILVLLLAWIATLFVSEKMPNYQLLGVHLYLLIGLVSYFLGVIFSAIKEAI